MHLLLSRFLLLAAVGAPVSALVAHDPPQRVATSELQQLDLRVELAKITEWAAAATLETATRAECVRASEVVRVCGELGDTELVPALTKLADACSEKYMRSMALEALDAQARLGVPTSHFIGLAAGFANKPFLAGYAALVVGRRADDDGYAKLQALVHEVSKSTSVQANLFVWAAQRASYARALRASLNEGTREVALGRLARLAVGGHRIDAKGHLEDIQSRADPEVVVAREELLRRSAAEPFEFAKALATSRLDGIDDALGLSPEAMAPRLDFYRDVASTYLARESALVFHALRPHSHDEPHEHR